VSTASALGLTADDAIVLHNSNKLALRLVPCDVFARVAHAGREVARFEVELAQQLAEAGSPVAALEPRVEPLAYERDGFAITLWTYYEPVTPKDVSPADYARALERLHAGMRGLDVASPHFTDRVAEAEQVVASCDDARLAEADRELLGATLRSLRRAVVDRGAVEQLLHGEPHPGNLLSTKDGPRFIDLETCCRGPVEFDLAHVPEQVSRRYTGADPQLLHDCRGLVLAMVTAWRFEPGDQLPNGQRAAEALLRALRAGPPWPALDAVMLRAGRSRRAMKRILITGMSATGKSRLIRELIERGYQAVDLDHPAWSHHAPDGEWVWREDRVRELLDAEDGDVLFVSGCASNQVQFHRRFDAIVLLSAPEAVLRQRLASRTTNAFGKRPEELAQVLRDLAETEPKLRHAATHEIDASAPLDDVLAAVLRIAGVAA
jgi:dephospho-CoA kinase